MIDTLYLIAHKVRGEPAFDVAIQMECPECSGEASDHSCECDGFGSWWIIPTSGHRAHPYWYHPLEDLTIPNLFEVVPDLPPGLPDHYTVSASPRGATDARPEFLRALLARPTIKINRRGL